MKPGRVLRTVSTCLLLSVIAACGQLRVGARPKLYPVPTSGWRPGDPSLHALRSERWPRESTEVSGAVAHRRTWIAPMAMCGPLASARSGIRLSCWIRTVRHGTWRRGN